MNAAIRPRKHAPISSQPRPALRTVQPAAGTAPVSARHAELVEDYHSGRRYLRAHVSGRYLWQPLKAAAIGDAIPDSGIWQTGPTLYAAYWLCLAQYRRKAGQYHRSAGQARRQRIKSTTAKKG